MRIRPRRVASLVAAGLLIAALTTDASSVVAPPAALAAATGPTLPLGHVGRWMTDDASVVSAAISRPAATRPATRRGRIRIVPPTPRVNCS